MQVFRGNSDAQESGTAPETGEQDSKDGKGGLDKVKTAVFRKAGNIREGLRSRLQEDPKAEAFWTLPSTRANYAELSTAPSSNEAVNRVRSLGGKLKGSLARKGREVSSGVVSIAQGVRQKGQSLKETVGQSGQGVPPKTDSGSALDDANLGDSIFAIGSDEEDAWSDADGFWDGHSDGNSSETPSTRSMSARAAAGITSEAGSAEGPETEHKELKEPK